MASERNKGRVRTVEEWVGRLSSRDSGSREEALSALEELLVSGEPESRERTARALLEELGRPGTAVAEPLLFLLQRGWWPPQPGLTGLAVQSVLTVLARMEAEAPALENAAGVLTGVCRVDPSQLAALDGMFQHPRPAVRSAMARVVGRLGTAAASELPRLLALLEDEEPVALSALESLAALAPLAPELTAPRLLEEVRGTDGARLYLALVSLRGLLDELSVEGRPAPALPGLESALLRTLTAPEAPIRQEAASLLGLCGAQSPAAIAALREHLRDESPHVAARSAVALVRSGAPAAEALFLLKGQLSPAASRELQEAAMAALEEADPAQLGRAKGMLETVARDAAGLTREALFELLGQIS
ncbi:HEAT repeat domain-containing protein [Corallococcus aberystwythensis]|uniref:HEAT repeat domain-containing protein n=1 Tax=Corallococcus aberystwythensis TaxID=2316722 RepID=UPI0013155138|nr:HEAT repeat domain-containing protein [Corallococcus aberystwythensis]